MYKLSRLMLLAAVAIYGYCLGLLVVFSFTESPAFGWVLVFIGFAVLSRLRKKIALALSAHGTACWAGEDQLRRAMMIDARRGLILGRLLGSAKVGLTAGIKSLLDAKIKAKDACRQFFSALQRRQPAAPRSAATGNHVHLLRAPGSREIHRTGDSLPPDLRRVQRRHRLVRRIGPRHGQGPATHGT